MRAGAWVAASCWASARMRSECASSLSRTSSRSAGQSWARTDSIVRRTWAVVSPAVGTITATSGSLPPATTQSRGVLRVQLLTSVTSSDAASRTFAARNGTASHSACGLACAIANGSHSPSAARTTGRRIRKRISASPAGPVTRLPAGPVTRLPADAAVGVAEDLDAPGPGHEAQAAAQHRDGRAGGEDPPEGPAGPDAPAQRRGPLPGALGGDEPVEAADREVGLAMGQAIGVDDRPRVADLAGGVEPAGERPGVVDEEPLARPGVVGDVARGRVDVDPRAVDP